MTARTISIRVSDEAASDDERRKLDALLDGVKERRALRWRSEGSRRRLSVRVSMASTELPLEGYLHAAGLWVSSLCYG
jgi:hypothetical protein